METVAVGDLAVGTTYLMPWRPAGIRAGRIMRQGHGSVTVHQPRHEGDGWERTAIAKGTQVVLCDPSEYESQGFGEGGAGGRVKNKSTIRKPVEVVWGLCDEIIGRDSVVLKEDRAKVIDQAVEQGVNKNTALTQFYAWRKRHGRG